MPSKLIKARIDCIAAKKIILEKSRRLSTKQFRISAVDTIADAQAVPLSKRREDIRLRAVERMEELYESDMTWTEAEKQTKDAVQGVKEGKEEHSPQTPYKEKSKKHE